MKKRRALTLTIDLRPGDLAWVVDHAIVCEGSLHSPRKEERLSVQSVRIRSVVIENALGAHTYRTDSQSYDRSELFLSKHEAVDSMMRSLRRPYRKISRKA